jgi:hypothetical protein
MTVAVVILNAMKNLSIAKEILRQAQDDNAPKNLGLALYRGVS